jgi:serine/threonine protein kinase
MHQCKCFLCRPSNDKASPVSSSNLTAKVEIEILKAFDAIHSLGVIHGDIRGDNILVGKDGNSTWIVDFEFAEIIPEGFDEKDAKITQETGAVEELLRKIKIPE